MDNRAQHEFWNGVAGQQWAEQDALMSRLLAPVSHILLESDLLPRASRVLNIGCGGGSDTHHLLAALDDRASVTGVDISEPLLAVAQQRLDAEPSLANRVRYQLADAAKDSLGDERYDLVFSRFGVMFFANPTAAFSHIRAHCASNASLLFASWQAAAENDWVTVPMSSALSILDAPTPPPPRAPGPFAFAELEYMHEMLSAAGWGKISIEPRNVTLRWGHSGDLVASAKDLLRTGPVGRLLVDADQATRQQVYAAVADALAPYASDQGVVLSGAIWIVSAKNN